MSYPLVIRLMIAMTLMPDASVLRGAGPAGRCWRTSRSPWPGMSRRTRWSRSSSCRCPSDVMESRLLAGSRPLIADDEPSAVMLAGHDGVRRRRDASGI